VLGTARKMVEHIMQGCVSEQLINESKTRTILGQNHGWRPIEILLYSLSLFNQYNNLILIDPKIQDSWRAYDAYPENLKSKSTSWMLYGNSRILLEHRKFDLTV